MITWIVLAIFGVTFFFIIFEIFDQTVMALMGALLMVLVGALNFEEAIHAIEFETIILLLAMMLLVEVARESGIFSQLTVWLAKKSGGNPLGLFLLFMGMTAFASAFLDNVTTIVLMIPMTIELMKGMGRDPKPYILGEILFSNIGGALTLIGDPPNILIGGATGLTFNDFIVNLWIPIFSSIAVIILSFVILFWNRGLKPIGSDLGKLFMSSLLLKKIEYKFLSNYLNKAFVWKSVMVLCITVMGFLLQRWLHLSGAIVALIGAVLLLLVAAEEANLEHSLRSIDWSTLLFFGALFVLVGAVEKVGVLDLLGQKIVSATGGSYAMLLLTILWVSGITSMVLNNIPFVTLMIPVIFNIQQGLAPGVDPNLLWWALSLGTCLGGNATVIGASANVMGVSMARKENIEISFFEFMKIMMPMTLITLIISSIYLLFRI